MSDDQLKDFVKWLRERQRECNTISSMNANNHHERLFGGKASAFKEIADQLESRILTCNSKV